VFQLGVGGMLVIAALTDHCCHLIVKTKNHAIDKLMKVQQLGKATHLRGERDDQQRYNSYDTMPKDSGMEEEDDDFEPRETRHGDRDVETVDEDEDAEEYHFVDHRDVRDKISQSMSYGDIGNLCYGRVGLGIVNFFIAMTQFGFCTGYFIFIGNTIHSLFPFDECITVHVNATNSTNATDVTHCHKVYVKTSNINQTEPVKYIDHAPDLRILVISPILIFFLFALIRNVRYLGCVSVMANLSILFGIVSVFGYLVYTIISKLKFI